MKVEDKLHHVLEAQANSVRPTDPGIAWRQLQRAVVAKPRRTGEVRVALAAVAVLVAVLAILVLPGSGPDMIIRTGPADSPPGWTTVSDADESVTLSVPDGWQRLDPGTSNGGREVLTVGTTARPSNALITACKAPVSSIPGSYISLFEYPPEAALVPPAEAGAIAPWAFQPRPSEFPDTHIDHIWCAADGSATSQSAAQNWTSEHTFSDGGRRFWARIVTIGDPEGQQQMLATRILSTLFVRPLTTGITEPPPVPTTLADQAFREQLRDVNLFEQGECRGDPTDAAQATDARKWVEVPCSDPHYIENFATYGYQGPFWEGSRGCTILFEAYTGQLRDAQDLGFSYQGEILNPEVAAATGLQQFRCIILNLSGIPPRFEPLLQSARRLSP